MTRFRVPRLPDDPKRALPLVAEALRQIYTDLASLERQPGDVALRVTTHRPVPWEVARVSPPHTWEDAIAFVRSADPADPNVVQPAWIVPVDNTPGAAPGSTGTSVARFDPGSYAFACISGTWPKVEFADPGGFEVGG